jgi:hypothetical protein
MNPLELELMRTRMRLEILERVALMSSVQIALRSTGDLDKAIDLVIQSIQLDDSLARTAWGHLDAAELALREGELQDIVDHMHAYLNLLRKARKPG